MPTVKIKLKKREEIAEGTMAFYFEKPAGFQFKAGQYLNLEILYIYIFSKKGAEA